MYIKIIIKHEFFKNNLNFIYALIGQRQYLKWSKVASILLKDSA